MEDNSSEEHRALNKIKGRKRKTRLDNSDSDEDNEKKNSSSKKENSNENRDSENSDENQEIEEIKNNKNEKNDKQIELQKKLKFIVNEVREKGKYEYNKQEIPENLKYHSDESDSSQVSNTKKSMK